MARHRIVAAGLAALAVTAVGPAAAASLDSKMASRWQWSQGVDRITDQMVSRATLLTTAIEEQQLGLEEARLALTCTAGKAVMDIDWSFKAAGPSNLTLEYRFAGRPGRGLKARYVNRSREEVADIADIRRFLADARTSDRLRLRVTSDAYGTTEANFRAEAGADVVARFTAACHVAAPR